MAFALYHSDYLLAHVDVLSFVKAELRHFERMLIQLDPLILVCAQLISVLLQRSGILLDNYGLSFFYTMATPAKKGLSAGTLNLKFMTRAAANDGTAAPALEKKKVVDEGEWDIGPDVRRALGIQGSSSSRCEFSPMGLTSVHPSTSWRW